MAFIDNTVWTGTEAAGFYSTILLTGDSKSLLKLFPNVKSKIKIPKFDMSGLIQASDCSFTSGGTSTLSEKTLEVCPLKINVEICLSTFEQDYLSTQLKAGSNGAEVAPASMVNYIFEQIALNTSAEIEALIWNGDTASSPADICDGLITKMVTGADTQTVSATTITKAVVLAEIDKVYVKIPDTIINRGKVVLFVSNKVAQCYKQAVAALNTIGNYNNGNYDLNYLGVKMIIAPGLTANQMVAAEPDNLFVGTDLMSDFDDVILIPQANLSGAKTARFVANFKFGVQYGVGAEIVLYN